MEALKYTSGNFLAHTSVSTPGAAFYAMKEHLKSAGWEVIGSGDGLALYSATGDILTTGASGAAGCNNARAWVRLRDPRGAGGREVTVQIISTSVGTAAGDSQFRIRDVPAGGTFDSGVPTYQTTPVATGDEQSVIGGGTSASPTGVKLFHWLTTPMYLFGGADEAAPYGFWFAAIAGASDHDMGHALALMPVAGAHAEDTDQYLWYADGSADAWQDPSMTDSGAIADNVTVRGRRGDGLAWRGYGACRYVETAALLNSMGGPDVVGTLVAAAQPLHGDNGGDSIKGWNKLLAWISAASSVGTGRLRVYDHPDGTEGGLIRCGDCVVPWDGSIPAAPGTWSNDGAIRLLTALVGPAVPTLTDLAPAEGEIDPDPEVARWTPITAAFTLSAGVPMVYARIGNEPHTWHLVFDGARAVAEPLAPEVGFSPMFADHSTVTVVGSVWSFSILPLGGWWNTPIELTWGQFQEAVVN